MAKKHRKRSDKGKPIVFEGERASWVESETGKVAAIRLRSWSSREERDAHRGRMERLGKFVADRMGDNAEAGHIVMDLTNPERSRARLKVSTKEFLDAHFVELYGRQNLSGREAVRFLEEEWGIYLSRRRVERLLESKRKPPSA